MSDSLANLAVKVDVTSVAAAMQQLEALAAKAGEIEQKVSGVATKVNQANNQAAVAATRNAKESTTQASKLDATIARQMRTVDQAKQRYENLDRSIRQSNLAMGVQTGLRDQAMRSLDRYLRVMQAENVTARQAASANIAYDRAMRNLNNNLKDGNTLIQQRVANTQRLSRESVAASRAEAAANRAALNAAIALERDIGTRRLTVQNVNNRAGRQLGAEESAPVIQANAAALARYEGVVRQFGLRSVEATKAQNDFKLAIDNSRNAISTQGGLLRTLNNNARAISASFGAANASLGGFSRVVFSTQAALSALAGTLGLREIVVAMMNLERFTNTLRTVSAGVVDFNNNMRFLFAEGNRIGFNVSEVGNSFARLSVAMQGAGFSGNETRDVFTQLATASRNFGVSSADTMGIIRALEQSMSKGKFMAEEVRLQMGDRLPIAMAALQAAVERVDGAYSNVSDRMERGTLDVQRYAAEFVRQIAIMSGGTEALERTSQSISAAFGRLGNAFTQAIQALEQGGFGRAVISIVDQIREMLTLARESGALETLGEISLTVANNLNILAAAIGAVAARMGVLGIAGLLGITTLVPAAAPAIGILALLAGAVAAVSIATRSGRNEITQFSTNLQENLRRSSANIERLGAEIGEAQESITRGTVQSNRELENSFDRLVNRFQQAGNEFRAAQRLAVEATVSNIRTEIAAEERRLEVLRRGRQEANDAGTNRPRVLSNLDIAQNGRAGLASPLSNDEPFREFSNRYRQFIEGIGQTPTAVRDIIAQLEVFRRELDALGSDSSGMRGAIFRRLQQDARRLVDTLKGLDDNTFFRQEEGISASEQKLRQYNSRLEEAIALNRELSGLAGPSGENLPAPPPLANFVAMAPEASRRRAAEEQLLRSARSAGQVGRGLAFEERATGSEVLSAIQSRRTALQGVASPDAARERAALDALVEQFRETERGAAGATDQLTRFFRTLSDQTEAAGDAEGVAGTLAQRLRELEKATQESARRTANAAEIERTRAAVMLAAERSMARFILTTNQQTAATQRVANAYRISGAAGRRAEIEQEAYTKALENAVQELDAQGNAIGRYREEVERLIPVIERRKAAEAALEAARTSVNDRRQEIELLEQEGRLIGTNVNSREQEVAALRERARLINAGVTDQSLITESEALARRAVSIRQQNTQIENSFNEISSAGEQAFERIGNSITEAFANGTLRALSFRDIMKAVMSEIIQRVAKLAILNPILNSLFGGTRGTLGTALSGVSSINGGGGGFISGLGSIGSLFGGSTNKAGGTASGGGIFGGGNMFTSIGGLGGATSYLFGGALGPGGMGPPTPGLFGTGGQLFGMDAARLIGGIGGIGAGAFGIYSGIQKGGIGGAIQGVGGALGMVGGAASLGLLGAGMAALAPILGPAAILVGLLGSFLPGQKPSSKAQTALLDFGEEDIELGGFTGRKFSAENQSAARQVAEAIMDQATKARQITGFQATDRIVVEMSDRGAILRSRFGNEEFSRDEAGARALSQRASEVLLANLKEIASDFNTLEARVTRASTSLEGLEENFKFLNDVYRPLIDNVSAFVQQKNALAKTYDDAISKAKELGLETAVLSQRREEELNKLQVARNREVDTIRRTLAAQAAGNNALAEMVQQQTEAANAIDELTKRLKDLGATAQEIERDTNNLRIAQLRQQREATGRAIREAEGTGFIDAINDLLLSRIAVDQMGFDPQTRNLAQKLNDRQLETVARNLSPTMLQSGMSTFQSPQVRSIFTRVLGEQRQAAATQQRDVIDTAQGRQSLVQAREMIRAFEQLAPQLGALGLTELAWQSLAAQLESFMEGLADDQIKLLTAFDNMTGRLEDDLIRGIAQTTLAQRELALTIERTRSAEERVIRGLSTLIDFTRGLQVGSLSALSPQAQLDVAQQQFDRTARSALGGDFAAIERLPSYAESYLNVARELFGSGQQYADIFGRVVGSLEGVAETPADTLTASAMAVEIQTQTQTLVGELSRLREEVAALKNEVVQQGIRPTRVTA